MADTTDTPIDREAPDPEPDSNQPHLLHLTILVGGTPERRNYPAHQKVEDVIKSLLPEGQRHEWAEYQLSERLASDSLNVQQTLGDDNVHDGDILSLTKRDGGGGSHDC